MVDETACRRCSADARGRQYIDLVEKLERVRKIDSDVAVQRKRKLVLTASSVGATAAYCACLYLMYLKHASILQRLDPVLQKLVYK